MRWLRPGVALAVVIVMNLALSAPARADTLWLDQPLKQWNQPGMAAPRADAGTDEPGLDPRCLSLARPAETPMDRELESAGWSLFSSYEAGWGITLITALSGHDGMCRPWGYHAFVYVDGKFAGTLAPEASAARSDGALATSDMRIQNDGHINASFVRYADSDPLCCPSRPWIGVTYRIDRTPNGPVVIAEQKNEITR